MVCWWRTLLCGIGGALSDGATYCLLLVLLCQMAHRMVWCWCTLSDGVPKFCFVGGALSDGAPYYLGLVVLY
jgi:hypothetical protein